MPMMDVITLVYYNNLVVWAKRKSKTHNFSNNGTVLVSISV